MHLTHSLPADIATGDWACLCSPAPPLLWPEELSGRPRRGALAGRDVVQSEPGTTQSPGSCVSLWHWLSLDMIRTTEGGKWKRMLTFNRVTNTPAMKFSVSLIPLTFENPQDHIPVLHPGPVEGDTGVGAHGESSGQRGDKVEGLGQPLAGQLPGMGNGCETGLQGRLWGVGRGSGCAHRHGKVFGGVEVWGLEGGVGTLRVQGDAFVLQNVDTRWS